MIKTFTKNELVKYLYKESTKEENIEIHQQLLTDLEVEEELSDLESISAVLDSFIVKTPSRVTKNILKYSADFN